MYYPAATAKDGSEVPVLIHSKLMTVDDRFLTIGSANTSNRSMGLDTELNVSWEATSPDDRKVLRSIRRARVNLLAEHCGLRKQPDARRMLRRKRGLVAYLDQLARNDATRSWSEGVAREIDAADKLTGSARKTALGKLAAKVEGDAQSSADPTRVRAIAGYRARLRSAGEEYRSFGKPSRQRRFRTCG